MIRQEYASWVGGIVFSLALHTSLFLQSGAQLGMEDARPANLPLTTRLNFYREVKPEPVEIIKPEPAKPKPVPKPKSRPKPKPKPVEPKKITPPEPEPVQQQIIKPQPKGQLTNPVDALFLKQQQQVYIQQLLSHIESHKFYPRSARQRGVEGKIKVSFTLQVNGKIKNMQLEGGARVLQEATRQAMQNAVPLPLPPASTPLPRQIQIGIIYSLTH
ncbi:MAG: energy transducer TonB [Gammaproteobacteria bacterium]|nr:energy transducer TonB [Gammaproteobacteria bacterium]